MNSIQFPLPNGFTFSVAQWGKVKECAVLRNDDFVPLGVWYAPSLEDDSVLILSGGAEQLAAVLERAIDWAKDNAPNASH